MVRLAVGVDVGEAVVVALSDWAWVARSAALAKAAKRPCPLKPRLPRPLYPKPPRLKPPRQRPRPMRHPKRLRLMRRQHLGHAPAVSPARRADAAASSAKKTLRGARAPATWRPCQNRGRPASRA